MQISNILKDPHKKNYNQANTKIKPIEIICNFCGNVGHKKGTCVLIEIKFVTNPKLYVILNLLVVKKYWKRRKTIYKS